jgi:nucleoside-diphosphate kinase
MVLEGKNAVQVIRTTMGKTNSAEALPGTIRGDFGIDLQLNMVHGSDSPENAEKEVSIFFNENELMDYSRDIDRWITGS